jgi:hypothetical protein
MRTEDGMTEIAGNNPLICESPDNRHCLQAQATDRHLLKHPIKVLDIIRQCSYTVIRPNHLWIIFGLDSYQGRYVR